MQNNTNTKATVLFDLIRGRRSIRRYTPEAIPKEVILHLIEAATWAPSAHNRQPWRFVAITQPEVKERLARAMGNRLRADRTADGDDPDAIERDVARSYARLTGAPVLIVICLSMVDMDSYPDPRRAQNERMMAVQSTAMAGQNLMLQAHALGLATCWMCAPLFVPALIRETLGLPADWESQGVITLGKPAETREKSRAPVDTRINLI